MKKVKIKSNSIDFNKYVPLFKMKLERERKSTCDFMNLHCLQRETECGDPIDSTRASFFGEAPATVCHDWGLSFLPCFLLCPFNSLIIKFLWFDSNRSDKLKALSKLSKVQSFEIKKYVLFSRACTVVPVPLWY